MIEFNPIGFVETSATEKVDENWGTVESKIVLEEDYRGGFEGLADFSHAIILTFLHEAHFDAGKHLQRRPQGRDDMPPAGIFSQRAKNRPNPIGVTAVEIISVADDTLTVRGLDAINGTPVLDVKPYVPHFDRVDDPAVPQWIIRLMEDYF